MLRSCRFSRHTYWHILFMSHASVITDIWNIMTLWQYMSYAHYDIRRLWYGWLKNWQDLNIHDCYFKTIKNFCSRPSTKKITQEGCTPESNIKSKLGKLGWGLCPSLFPSSLFTLLLIINVYIFHSCYFVIHLYL